MAAGYCAAIIGVILFLSSCKTYQIPVESFKEQFANSSTSELKTVATRDPYGGLTHYQTRLADVIYCIDKEGNPVKLQRSPSLEIRITDTNNKRRTFYFDLMRVDQTSVTGSISRLFPGWTKTIPLAAIKKVEIQDGKKKYSYVN
jgi:hypothetical protein